MWNLRQIFSGDQKRPHTAFHSNATLIGTEELLVIFGQNEENLILFDLRSSAEVDQFPFLIPGALLTMRVNLPDLSDWIPPRAIVVLYGAEQISGYSQLIHRLPQDTHFYLLRDGMKSWRQARLPLEPLASATSEGLAVWSHWSGEGDAEEGNIQSDQAL